LIPEMSLSILNQFRDISCAVHVEPELNEAYIWPPYAAANMDVPVELQVMDFQFLGVGADVGVQTLYTLLILYVILTYFHAAYPTRLINDII